jgi:hypothetical protein
VKPETTGYMLCLKDIARKQGICDDEGDALKSLIKTHPMYQLSVQEFWMD